VFNGVAESFWGETRGLPSSLIWECNKNLKREGGEAERTNPKAPIRLRKGQASFNGLSGSRLTKKWVYYRTAELAAGDYAPTTGLQGVLQLAGFPFKGNVKPGQEIKKNKSGRKPLPGKLRFLPEGGSKCYELKKAEGRKKSGRLTREAERRSAV